ncbi:MAG: hypothetical protein IPK00_11290 [Deltaproteobacteria bacterium]|nr:hypothetical protein [Deltaproteobacteria bacterium]
MLPDPLHPAVVHFPIVLALLAPAIAIGLFWAIETRKLPARAWLVVVLLQAVIFGAGWLTAETGEEEEERVERIVREDPIEEHEEAAEWFIWIAGITLPIAGAGLLSGGLGTGARGVAFVGTLMAALAVAQVGHTGGELVYKHGAALAYLDGPTVTKAMGRKAMKKLLSGSSLEIPAVLDGSGGGSGDPSNDSGQNRRGRE